ncbi:unnamed protein product [Peniophora sp. CBMAI 1063]|nr:unnamed protein product [Peniophora sp. CBMAI 1063]
MSDQPDYTVEAVVAAQVFVVGHKLKWKYRVKWEGYDSSENTWEPAENINPSDADGDNVERFWTQAPVDGRNRVDVKAWKPKETVWLSDRLALEDPACPPQQRRVEYTSHTPRRSTTGSASRQANIVASSSSLLSTSKRKRADEMTLTSSSTPTSTSNSTKRLRSSTFKAQLEGDTVSGPLRALRASLPPAQHSKEGIQNDGGSGKGPVRNHNAKPIPGPEARWLTFADEQLDIVRAGPSAIGDGELVTLKKEKIEREIQAALGAIARMRMRGNQLKAVYRLPPQVLTAIFAIHASQNPPAASKRGNGWSKNERRLGWIEVSHVCRPWRNAALEDPPLWTDIPYHDLGSKWAKTFLERAQRHSDIIPINWQMDSISPKTPSSSMSGLLMDHLHHVHKLRLYLPSIPSEMKWIRNLGQSAPLLTSLHLESSCDPPFLLPATSKMPFSAPLLETLTLKGLSPSLGGVTWTNLCSLSIAHAELHFPELYEALSSTTHLERLALERIALTGTIEPPYRIALDMLKAVELSMDWRSCAALSNALTIPVTSSFAISFEAMQSLGLDGSQTALRDVFSVIQDRLRYLQQHDYQTHTVTLHEDYRGIFTIESKDKTRAVQRWAYHSRPPGATNSFKIAAGLSPSMHNIATIFPLLSLDRCRSLSVCSSTLWTEDAWVAVLPSTRQLKTLEISGTCARTWIQAVAASIERRDKPALLPRLAELEVDSVNFDDWRSATDPSKKVFKDLLKAFLKKRSGQKHIAPIKDLSIRSCDVLTSMISSFKKIPGLKVDWDGESGDLWEEDREERWDDGEEFSDYDGYEGYGLWA